MLLPAMLMEKSSKGGRCHSESIKNCLDLKNLCNTMIEGIERKICKSISQEAKPRSLAYAE